MTPRAGSEEPTFAQARARLDQILDELESGEADVDQLAARVQEASQLIRFCSDRLAATRQQVRRIVAEMTAAEAGERAEADATGEGAGAASGGEAAWPETEEGGDEPVAPPRTGRRPRRPPADEGPGELPF